MANPMKMRPDATSLTATETEPRTKTCSGDLVPRHRTLDGVVEAMSQADGIGLIDVNAFTTLVVRIDNSVYRITILTPPSRPFFVHACFGTRRTPRRYRPPPFLLSRTTMTRPRDDVRFPST